MQKDEVSRLIQVWHIYPFNKDTCRVFSVLKKKKIHPFWSQKGSCKNHTSCHALWQEQNQHLRIVRLSFQSSRHGTEPLKNGIWKKQGQLLLCCYPHSIPLWVWDSGKNFTFLHFIINSSSVILPLESASFIFFLLLSYYIFKLLGRLVIKWCKLTNQKTQIA